MALIREIIIDVETTGLADNDKIVEIGAIEMVNRRRTGRKFHQYINPNGKRSHPFALRLHGLSPSFLSQFPLFENIAEEFLDFIEGATLVFHNATFDLKFLNRELINSQIEDAEDPIEENHEIVDTLAMARRIFPGQSNKLDDLCTRFDISTDQRRLHGALIDARLTRKVYLRLLGF